MRTRIIAGLIVTLLSTAPVLAQSHPPKRAATITKWALIGAGAGFGIGFFHGMRVYDDAIFAEQKIWRTACLSALAGGIVGGFVGAARSSSARTPPVATRAAHLSQSNWAKVRLRAPRSPTDHLYRHLFRSYAGGFNE